MGHQIEERTYPATKSKQEIEHELHSYARQATWAEGGGGLPGCISWYNAVCKDYDEAHKFIDDHDGNYAQIAVRYLEHDRPSADKLKKYNELKTKSAELKNECYAFAKKPHFVDAKAKYIGCPTCGSKISREHLGIRNDCPVCKADMRPQSVIDKYKKMEARYIEAHQKAVAEYKKQESKCTVHEMWLVKIEYHV